MTEDKSVLVEYLGDTPILRIIDFLMENSLFDYSKKQMIEGTGLAKVTFYKYWGRLLETGMVRATRSFGKAKLYKIDRKSPVVRELERLELVLIESTVPQLAIAKTRTKMHAARS